MHKLGYENRGALATLVRVEDDRLMINKDHPFFAAYHGSLTPGTLGFEAMNLALLVILDGFPPQEWAKVDAILRSGAQVIQDWSERQE